MPVLLRVRYLRPVLVFYRAISTMALEKWNCSVVSGDQHIHALSTIDHRNQATSIAGQKSGQHALVSHAAGSACGLLTSTIRIARAGAERAGAVLLYCSH